MNRLALILVWLAVGQAFAAIPGPIRASWYGLSETATGDENRDALNRAFATGHPHVIVDRGVYAIEAGHTRSEEDWRDIRPVSNQTIEFQDGTVFNQKVSDGDQIYSLFFLSGVENVTFRGKLTINCDQKSESLRPNAKSSLLKNNGGWAVNIRQGCKRITVDGMTINRANGSAVTIGGTIGSSGIVFRNCVFDRSRQNNVSVTYADRVIFERCSFLNAGKGGGSPQQPTEGVDCEPNGHSVVKGGTFVRNVTFRDCIVGGNEGGGIVARSGVPLRRKEYNYPESPTQNIRIINLDATGQDTPQAVGGQHVDGFFIDGATLGDKGSVSLEACFGGRCSNVSIKGGYSILVAGCKDYTVEDVTIEGSIHPKNAVTITSTGSEDCERVTVKNVRILFPMKSGFKIARGFGVRLIDNIVIGGEIGYEIEHSTRCRFENNHAAGNTQLGFNIRSRVVDSVFEGNTHRRTWRSDTGKVRAVNERKVQLSTQPSTVEKNWYLGAILTVKDQQAIVVEYDAKKQQVLLSRPLDIAVNAEYQIESNGDGYATLHGEPLPKQPWFLNGKSCIVQLAGKWRTVDEATLRIMRPKLPLVYSSIGRTRHGFRIDNRDNRNQTRRCKFIGNDGNTIKLGRDDGVNIYRENIGTGW